MYSIVPIKCKHCGTFIGCQYELYLSLLDSGVSVEQALDSVELIYPCCRAAFITPSIYPDIEIDEAKLYNANPSLAPAKVTFNNQEQLAFKAPTGETSGELTPLANSESEAEYANKKAYSFNKPVIDLNRLTIRKADGKTVKIPVAAASKWTLIQRPESLASN